MLLLDVLAAYLVTDWHEWNMSVKKVANKSYMQNRHPQIIWDIRSVQFDGSEKLSTIFSTRLLFIHRFSKPAKFPTLSIYVFDDIPH